MSVDSCTVEECCICFEESSTCLVRTACCGQRICEHCVASDRAYKNVSACPFCRRESYDVCDSDSKVAMQIGGTLEIDGTWDVQVTEKCAAGSSSYSATLIIEGDSARFNADDNHLEGALWQDLVFGKTPSGKSFAAKHRVRKPPLWMGDHAVILDSSGLRGRLNEPDKATFTTSFVVDDTRGDEECEIIQTGWMKRRHTL